MDIESAVLLGYKDVYFTFDCIGDTILLISALKALSDQTGKKYLFGTNYKELAENFTHIDILDDFCEDNLSLENSFEAITAFW